MAIRNARLYQEAEKRQQRLETLVAVAQRLTRGLDLPTVLIAEATALVFEGEAGFRVLEGESWCAWGRLPEPLRPCDGAHTIGESISGRVATSGEAIITADTAAEEGSSNTGQRLRGRDWCPDVFASASRVARAWDTQHLPRMRLPL